MLLGFDIVMQEMILRQNYDLSGQIPAYHISHIFPGLQADSKQEYMIAQVKVVFAQPLDATSDCRDTHAPVASSVDGL